MPHLTIQATPNVVIPHSEQLLKTLNKALWESGHFKSATDIKSRLLNIPTFLVGVEDDEQADGFIYAQLKIMAGRDEQTKNQLAALLVTTIETALCESQSGRATLQICVEVEDLSDIYHKKILASCPAPITDLFI